MSDDAAKPVWVHVNRRGSGHPSYWAELSSPWVPPALRAAIAYCRERGFDVVEQENGERKVVRLPIDKASR